MDKTSRVLELAERVVALRAQLAAVEGELRGVLGERVRAVVSQPVLHGGRIKATRVPVSQRVRDLLHDGNKALTFGELVALVGGRPAAMAARSALKKLRERKEVRFSGGKYSWTGK